MITMRIGIGYSGMGIRGAFTWPVCHVFATYLSTIETLREGIGILEQLIKREPQRIPPTEDHSRELLDVYYEDHTVRLVHLGQAPGTRGFYECVLPLRQMIRVLSRYCEFLRTDERTLMDVEILSFTPLPESCQIRIVPDQFAGLQVITLNDPIPLPLELRR